MSVHVLRLLRAHSSDAVAPSLRTTITVPSFDESIAINGLLNLLRFTSSRSVTSFFHILI